MQLIDEGFRAWWKKYSVLTFLAIGAVNSTWIASPEVQELMSVKALAAVNAVLAVLGTIGRFIKQVDAALQVVDDGGDQ